MNQTPYDQLLNQLQQMGYDEPRSPDIVRDLLMGYTSPARSQLSQLWLREERPNTPARGSIQYLQALTQLADRFVESHKAGLTSTK
jgi:hypothetical protein